MHKQKGMGKRFIELRMGCGWLNEEDRGWEGLIQ